MQTLALMVVAVARLGCRRRCCSGSPPDCPTVCDRALRPVLDTMQVLPAFAYLLPFVLVFGIGIPAALFATVIYAAPPMARLTALGPARRRPRRAGGVGFARRQRPGSGCWTARLPLARKEMLLGLNQTIMMALSMVVIASVIGAGGLGDEVYQALSTVDVGEALAAGIPIVLIAIWLDRTTAAAGERLGESTPRRRAAARPARPGRWWSPASSPRPLGRLADRQGLAGGLDGGDRPARQQRRQTGSPSTSRRASPSSAARRCGPRSSRSGSSNPLRDGLQGSPWWLLLLVVAALAWLVGTWRTALTATLAMAAIGVLGVWDTSLDTLAQVLAGARPDPGPRLRDRHRRGAGAGGWSG